MRIFLIFLSATLTLFALHSATFLSQTTSGNLLNRWIIEFEIFVNDFGGYILECDDSKGNKFHILIEDHNMDQMVTMQYNKQHKSQRLSKFCQCYPCQNINVRMRIMLKDGALRAQCNSATTEFFYINSFKREWYQPNFVTISMGKSRRISYRSSRMVGCVRSLHFNGISIEFNTKKNQDDYLNTEAYFYDCNRTIRTTKSVIVATYHGDVTRVAESTKIITASNKMKEPSYSTKTATSSHNKSTKIIPITNKIGEPSYSTKTATSSYIKSTKIIPITNKIGEPSYSTKTTTSSHNKTTEINQTTDQIKGQNHSITNAFSEHHRTKSFCPKECLFWKWFAIIEIFSIMVAILYMNRRKCFRVIKKVNRTSPNIEVAVHESNHNSSGQSAYSSLNTGLPNPNRFSILGSDDSYMIPRMPSLVENRPSLPPRKDRAIFKRIEHMISDPRPKSYDIADYRMTENNWTSFIESLQEEEDGYIYIKK